MSTPDFNSMTQAQIAAYIDADIQAYIAAVQQAAAIPNVNYLQLVALAEGTATGGSTKSPGRYPITDPTTGLVTLVPSPAYLLANASTPAPTTSGMYPDISTFFLTGDTDWSPAFARAAGKTVSLSAVNYNISSPIQIGSGSGFIGLGISQSKITQTTNNTPILQLYAQDSVIRGCTLAYASQQSSAMTSADAIMTVGGDTWRTFIEDIEILNSYRGLHINFPLFSCVLRKIFIRGCSGAYIASEAAHSSTGNTWDDIYCANNLYNQPMALGPIIINSMNEGHWGQLNIEHTQINGAALYVTNSQMHFSSVHMEDITPIIENCGLVNADFQSNVVIDVLTHVESQIVHSNANNIYDFFVGLLGTNSSIEIAAFAEYTNTVSGVNYAPVKQQGANSTAPYSSFRCRRALTNTVSVAYPSIQNLGGPALIPVLRQWDDQVFYTGGPGGMGRRTGTAPPTAGTYVAGEEMRNTAMIAGAPRGWVCEATGTPGSWRAYQ